MKITLSAVLVLLLMACATSSAPTSDIRVTAGSSDVFRRAQCYGSSDIRDKDDPRVTRHAFERDVLRRSAFLHLCGSGDKLVLSIAYQAGRGACIDCDPPTNRWSGFAFITISSGGNELAAAEWHGEGASDGRILLRRFVDDIWSFVRGGRPNASPSASRPRPRDDMGGSEVNYNIFR